MQHVRTIFRLQAHYQAIYCCGRHLTDGHVTGGHVTGLTSSLPHSEAVSNRHITPASDLNIKIYQPSYNDELKDIFGENKREHKEKVNFADFKSLQPELRERLKELGYEKPLPVQHRTLEATLRGKDAVIKSVTGSGKTLAFIIPLLNKVGAQRIGEERGRAPQAVIVAPTRELCRQIASVLEEFIGPERVSLMTAGLVKVKKQARQARLESKDIIVATPGRTMQLISNNIIRPKSLKFLVLDEADELLHDLFYQHMRWILDNSNPSKQMIVTTATVPSNVQFVIDRYMKYHEYIDLGAASVSLPEHIKHKAVLYDVGVFKRCLKWVLKNEHGSCSMLFVKHKDDCSRVTELVRSFGYSVKYINSDVPENSRVRVMSEFYENKFEILVATDLASRGVDVPECSLVVHIKPDLDNKKYIHRSGRTGRAGRQGTSVLMLVNEKDDHMDFLGNLSDIVNFDFYLYTNLLQYRLTPRDRL
ncbi:uncharacterized protein LOC134824619 isoform X2 [Bolinopsis microptera]|uniref:uncharacterized protein LOC134824619 isoform X2 n=2 Tax=Bolinopsis microptera TaxID=2820187 RepID=UPI003079F829